MNLHSPPRLKIERQPVHLSQSNSIFIRVSFSAVIGNKSETVSTILLTRSRRSSRISFRDLDHIAAGVAHKKARRSFYRTLIRDDFNPRIAKMEFRTGSV